MPADRNMLARLLAPSQAPLSFEQLMMQERGDRDAAAKRFNAQQGGPVSSAYAPPPPAAVSPQTTAAVPAAAPAVALPAAAPGPVPDSMAPRRVSGPVEAAGGGFGSDIGAPQLYGAVPTPTPAPRGLPLPEDPRLAAPSYPYTQPEVGVVTPTPPKVATQTPPKGKFDNIGSGDRGASGKKGKTGRLPKQYRLTS